MMAGVCWSVRVVAALMAATATSASGRSETLASALAMPGSAQSGRISWMSVASRLIQCVVVVSGPVMLSSR